jgi:putative endonuclease
MYSVYIIQSKRNGRYYIGMTEDLLKRVADHNSNKNKSTKNKGPWELVYSENCIDKKTAWLRERQIKSYKGGEAFQKLLKN